MKIVYTDTNSVSDESVFEKQLKERGIEYRFLYRDHPIGGKVKSKYDIIEYISSQGIHTILVIYNGGSADVAFEDGVFIHLEENEEFNLSELEQLIIDYEKINLSSWRELWDAKFISQKFGIKESAVRRAIFDGRLKEYKDAIKHGNAWLVLPEAAQRLWGKKNIKEYRKNIKKC